MRDIDSIVKDRCSMLGMIESLFSSNTKVSVVVEIGTGDGRFLKYLYDKYNSVVDHFVGVDLHKDLMTKNNKLYGDKISFVQGDFINEVSHVFQWKGDILIVASRTLTLLTQTEMIKMLKRIKQTSKSKVHFILFEQNDLDMEKETKSRIRSEVYFYSHNYLKIFNDCGFNIIDKNIKINNKLLNDYGITIRVQLN